MNAFVIGEIIFGLVGVFGLYKTVADMLSSPFNRGTIGMEILMIGSGGFATLFMLNNRDKKDASQVAFDIAQVVILVLVALIFLRNIRKEEEKEERRRIEHLEEILKDVFFTKQNAGQRQHAAGQNSGGTHYSYTYHSTGNNSGGTNYNYSYHSTGNTQKTRDGSQKHEESFCQKEDDIQQAMRILGLNPGFTKTELRSRRKELAKRFHPDVGGDPDYLKRINAAYDLLEKYC